MTEAVSREGINPMRAFWTDTETTGLDSRQHFAFQISYFIADRNKVLIQRTLEMRPDNYADFVFDPGAEEVHGYSREQIIAFPSEKDQYNILIGDLKSYAGDKITIAGYNVEFDIRFIKALFWRNKDPYSRYSDYSTYFRPMPCDVLQLAQNHRIAGKLDLPNLQLETVCSHFGISTEKAHHSMTDILNTKRVFDILMGV
jgi:DNA polymerase III alpha subunit (gram-positive type)